MRTGPSARPAVPAPPEVEIVTRATVSCDGGEGALGHPRVWLHIDESVGYVECGYCDKKFLLAGAEGAPGSNASVGASVGDRTDGDGLDERA